jgi:hypothetical protein
MNASYDPGQYRDPKVGPQDHGRPPYYGQPYPQPIYVQTDNGNNTSLAPVTSLVTGLAGFFTAWIPILGMVAWLLGPIAILFGILGLRRGKTEHKIMSIVGIITGTISLLVCIGYVVMLAAASISA